MKDAKKFPVFATLLMLLGVAVLCALGDWQLQRLAWKEDLIARIEAQSASDKIPLPAAAFTPDNEFKTGTLSGRFLNGKDIALAPRTNDGTPGVHILTPFVTNDGATLLVNRGWLGLDEEAQPAQERSVTGTIRQAPRPNMFTPMNDPANDIWYRVNLDEITTTKGLSQLAPVLFYQSCNENRAPNPCALALNIRNDHRQYAFFWFAMAGVLIAVYVLRFWKK